ncbi:adhesion G-protein coupled receptor D1-like [Orbicella faveolata]|uniref:adhesion G-protein coupled receptor D1-like n=1 Tax=Orbicella faveolata TaxID=48498 RepID=UPI0009E2F110|nr:adhesion G-protein coupled receptor D1-like [Orbicella faveolata]
MALKATLILLPLLGVTWLLGFLQANSDSAVMSYAFVLLNCVQGVYFFVINIVLNQEVSTAFKKKFLKKNYSWAAFRFSSSSKMHDSVREGDILSASVKRATAYSNESFSSRKSFVKRQMEEGRNENSLYAPNTQIKRQWQEVNDY